MNEAGWHMMFYAYVVAGVVHLTCNISRSVYGHLVVPPSWFGGFGQ